MGGGRNTSADTKQVLSIQLYKQWQGGSRLYQQVSRNDLAVAPAI